MEGNIEDMALGDLDIYTDEGSEDMLNCDGLSSGELGFMNGYNSFEDEEFEELDKTALIEEDTTAPFGGDYDVPT